MRLLTSSALLSFCTFACFTNALPISEARDKPQFARRKVPYSVVPVDGGQPAGAAPSTQVVTKDSTQTVTIPPKTLSPVTETILSTTVMTESEAPATITTYSTPIHTPIPAPEVSPSVSTTSAIVTSLVSATDTITITSTPTLTPYDDGMWHTTYYKVAEPSSFSETSASLAVNGNPPATIVEPITTRGIPSNRTYALLRRGNNKLKPSNITVTLHTATSGTMAALKTKPPPMPSLPTSSELINPTEVPVIDLTTHKVPSFRR